jgi:hypothetical protein
VEFGGKIEMKSVVENMFPKVKLSWNKKWTAEVEYNIAKTHLRSWKFKFEIEKSADYDSKIEMATKMATKMATRKESSSHEYSSFVIRELFWRHRYMGPPTWILGQASGITYYAMALKIHNRSVKIRVY